MYLEDVRTTLDLLKKTIVSELTNINGEVSFKRKADSSLVTYYDHFISDLFKKEFKKKLPDLNFFSEEDFDELLYPTIILDPIDGTKEFAQGSDECCISFGIYYGSTIGNEKNFSWIYNFRNGFEIDSTKSSQEEVLSQKGFVSRTEYEKGLYNSSDVQPVGSIAYKLALLAAGKCRFVITKKPKHLWDILAGTHINFKRSIFLYDKSGRIEDLNKITFDGPLLWCREEDFSNLKHFLKADV